MLATILAQTDRTAEARAHAMSNLAAIRATGSVTDFPVTMYALADVETRDGDPATGLRLICAARQLRIRHELLSLERFPPLDAYVADVERRARAAMTDLPAEAVWDAASSTPPEDIVDQVLARPGIGAAN